MKSGSCARNRKRRANERGGTPSADGYYRSLSPPSSLFHSLFLLHTQLDARYFRRPSSFGQFHCTVGFPPSLPFFLFVFLFLSLAEFPATRNTLRPKTPRAEIRHIITSPGRYLARSLMKRKSRGSRPHLRSFVTYSPESSSRARARARFHCARCTKIYRV